MPVLVDPDQTPDFVMSDLGLYSLPSDYPFGVSRLKWVNIPVCTKVSFCMTLLSFIFQVAVEGNIGSGKSTCLEYFRKQKMVDV